jgi:SAM-dependent methyltransferase
MNSNYVRRFGEGVTHVDVLDIKRENPEATIYGDLRRLDQVPDATYDCFIVTQVFQYIDDVEAAVRETVRVLKPGGTALVTLPALHKLESPTYSHFWRFTPLSAKYLFGKYFPDDHLHIQSWGNVLSGMAFWVGLARQDVRKKHLDRHDAAYPCTITVRATKPNEVEGVPPAAPVRIEAAHAEPPREGGSGLTWSFIRAMCLGLAAGLGF